MEKVDILRNNNVQVDSSLEFWGDMRSYNDNLKEYKIKVKDVFVGKEVIKDYKCRKAYLSAQKIYKNQIMHPKIIIKTG